MRILKTSLNIINNSFHDLRLKWKCLIKKKINLKHSKGNYSGYPKLFKSFFFFKWIWLTEKTELKSNLASVFISQYALKTKHELYIRLNDNLTNLKTFGLVLFFFIQGKAKLYSKNNGEIKIYQYTRKFLLSSIH